MRLWFYVTTAILIFLTTSTFAARDLHPRRQVSQAFLNFQQSSESSTKPLPPPSAVNPTLVPEAKGRVEAIALETGTGATERPAVTMAALVVLAGVLFGLGMGL